MYFKRVLQPNIEMKMCNGKAIILIGPRQVGKTTLIREILKDKNFLFLNGDDPSVRQVLNSPNTKELENIIGKKEYIFIDEAQRIEGVGLTSKIITDQFPNVQLVLSGSSAFELNNQINEPLTGRKWEFELFPVSWKEMENTTGYLEAKQQLNLRLIYGMYPEVLTAIGSEKEVLKELVSSYLYKDILALSGIRKAEVLDKLLRALAFQVGNEVSYNELAQLVGIDKNTVSNYIDMLCKAYVIFKLPSFSKNLRNEIKRNQKIYFYDNGVRNAVIGNLNLLETRTDKGALWENFIISERLKVLRYSKSDARMYFWRTVRQQEIDYVEENTGIIKGFEFKFNPKAKTKIPKLFGETYSTEVKVVNTENFREFLKV
ncbi:ATP-binding protein [Aequorivita marina]|uniref:ATP-binding protein n=1 Tax=Aequorivita marina TaxID=3073654 RepID=UPI002874FCF0|nr:ATP-binding protein [Aequorivita sp. S2608]MDS1299023.1 ATP-binding protein [Aequorivita sp. S2608]